MNKEHELSLDIRRTVLLGAYIQAWGMPLDRTISRKGDHRVEVYSFPHSGKARLNRYATVGVSGHSLPDGKVTNWELFLVTPEDDAGASSGEVVSFLLDVMAFSLCQNVRFEIGKAFDESPLAPKSWKARAFLLDEPRAEPEFLSEIHVGAECVKLIWVMPVHKDEFEIIKKSGIETFDEAAEMSEWSPADPRRVSFFDKAP